MPVRYPTALGSIDRFGRTVWGVLPHTVTATVYCERLVRILRDNTRAVRVQQAAVRRFGARLVTLTRQLDDSSA